MKHYTIGCYKLGVVNMLYLLKNLDLTSTPIQTDWDDPVMYGSLPSRSMLTAK